MASHQCCNTKCEINRLYQHHLRNDLNKGRHIFMKGSGECHYIPTVTGVGKFV